MKTTISVILVLILCGCTARSPWKVLQQESPLCAPHKAAVAKIRTCKPPPFVPATQWTEECWEVDGKTIQKYDVAKRIDKYLESIGFFRKQEAIEAWSEGVQQRVASHRFFIVSLKPTVVLMTPYDFGSTENKSINDLASVLNDRHLISTCLVNGYHYGRSVPEEQTYRWFSPDLRTEIQPVQKTEGSFRIAGDSVILTFGSTKTNEYYLIEREK
jgi:hypothetical protein